MADSSSRKSCWTTEILHKLAGASVVLMLVSALIPLLVSMACQTPTSPAGGSRLACASEAAEDALAASDISEAAALEYVKERSDCRTHNDRLLGR